MPEEVMPKSKKGVYHLMLEILRKQILEIDTSELYKKSIVFCTSVYAVEVRDLHIHTDFLSMFQG